MGLFNTTHIIQGKTDRVPYCKEVNITEKKAPTDESVRLLNEMQEKAQRNIISTIRIEENCLKAIVVYFQDDIEKDRVKYQIRFNLNGKDHIIDGHINIFELGTELLMSGLDQRSGIIVKALYKKYSELIMIELLEQSSDLIRELMKF